MSKREKNSWKKRGFLTGTFVFSLMILLGVGSFTYRLYERIVDDSKMIAWEMTLKSAQVLEFRLENAKNNLLAFTQEIAIGNLSNKEINRLVDSELQNHAVFRMHILGEDNTFLTDRYQQTPEAGEQLVLLCPEDGVFSAHYVGESGRWQTALAYTGTINGNKCRIYQEYVLEDFYLNDFMEFYDNQGYSYVISKEDGAFIMLPQNKYGQGLYSGLFTMLEAYESNEPEWMEKIHVALARNQGCTVQMEFKGEKSYFCFAPIESNSNWFVVSVIPVSVLQRNGLIAIGAIILLGIALLCVWAFTITLLHRRWKLYYEMEAAKQADKAKTSFLSNMSHEMRTPMNAIMGMTDIMRFHLSDQSRMKDCIDKIQLSSKYLLGIINDVLDMSKIEKNKMILETSMFSIASLLDMTLNLIIPQMNIRNHDFTVSVWWEGTEQLLGDQKRMSQILVNILSNAVKYTPEGGKVSLRVFCEAAQKEGEKARLRFEIEDNGIGMSREYQELIFEPFSQEKNSFSKGTGLGMAITAQMVHLMEGTITLQSEINRGSTFQVVLPLLTAAQGRRMEEELRGMKVLLVEQKKDTQKAAGYTLSRVGIRTMCADTPGEAQILLMREEKPDMVLLDDKLWKTADVLIQCAKEKDIPIYLIGYGYDCEISVGDGFFLKPLLPSRLFDSRRKAEEKQAVSGQGQPLDGFQILLAEDNELNAEIAIELLKHFGAKVNWCRDGGEAYEQFKHSSPGWYSLILMDIQMPEINGYEATAKIRLLDREDAGSIPILAMTADAFSDDVTHAFHAGMNGHISKPVDMQKLLLEIENVTKKESGYEEIRQDDQFMPGSGIDGGLQ